MICPMCGMYYEGVEILKDVWNNSTDEWCAGCASDQFWSDVARLARHRKQRILNRLKAIEKALPDSTNLAKLRLERSELDGELEKIEEAAG